jgi:nucleosome binding factor SPN SPT16 subunit
LQDKGHADLAEKLPKNLGAAVGIELRDNTQALSPTNEKPLKAGMAFNVALGISGLERADASDEEGKTYALFLADTVVVTAGGSPPDVATMTCPKDWKDVAYFVKDEEEEGSEGEEAEDGEDNEGAVGIRKSARTEQVDFKAREEERCVANEEIFALLFFRLNYLLSL